MAIQPVKPWWYSDNVNQDPNQPLRTHIALRPHVGFFSPLDRCLHLWQLPALQPLAIPLHTRAGISGVLGFDLNRDFV